MRGMSMSQTAFFMTGEGLQDAMAATRWLVTRIEPCYRHCAYML